MNIDVSFIQCKVLSNLDIFLWKLRAIKSYLRSMDTSGRHYRGTKIHRTMGNGG